MNEKRNGHAAVVCNGWVFAIGGYDGNSYLSTIEYISVADLMMSNPGNKKVRWRTLKHRIYKPRREWTAVAVYNRYTFVAGGEHSYSASPSLDVIDTSNEREHLVVEGPSMNIVRGRLRIASIGNRIYIVGGETESHAYRSARGERSSLEYLEFHGNVNRTEGTFASSWITDPDLAHLEPRSSHAVSSLGSNLVVAGGSRGLTSLNSVKVLDTKDGVVWYLPNLTKVRDGCSMVMTSNGLVVIAGYKVNTCETLPPITKKQQLKVRTLLLSLHPVTVRIDFFLIHILTSAWRHYRTSFRVVPSSTKKWNTSKPSSKRLEWNTTTKIFCNRAPMHKICSSFFNLLPATTNFAL